MSARLASHWAELRARCSSHQLDPWARVERNMRLHVAALWVAGIVHILAPHFAIITWR